MRTNFVEYDEQIWIVPDLECKIARTLQNSKIKYTNIEIIELSQIQANKDKTDGALPHQPHKGEMVPP